MPGLTALARVHEALNDMDTSISYYKHVLKEDANNVEAIACIGAPASAAEQFRG